MKKILMLGGAATQTPPIRYAHSQGHFVIVCDYNNNPPGRMAADKFIQVSTTDLDSILDVAIDNEIDAILTYASDPAAPTVAYVGNKLGLPSNPYESVKLLAKKNLYRQFLDEHGFNTPKFHCVSNIDDARVAFANLNTPIVVKPTDSSGSKGVTVINDSNELIEAIRWALSFSRAKKVILEEFVELLDYQIAGDGFIYDGKLVFRCFANEHFNDSCNGLVPVGESFPSIYSEDIQNKVHEETQRLIDLLALKFGAINFDVRIGKNDRVFLMEIGPRNGGNLIPEVTKYATGVDMIKYTVDAALGIDCSEIEMKPVEGFYSSFIFHSTEDGVLETIEFDNKINNKFIQKNLSVNQGDVVPKFLGSNCTLGTGILKFESRSEMIEFMDDTQQCIKVIVH